MTKLEKILLIVIGILISVFAGIVFYQNYQFKKARLDIETLKIEQKQLTDNIIRSQSQYVNEQGFKKFIEQNQIKLDAIEKDVKSLNGQINAINVVEANSSGQNVNNIPSTHTIPSTNPSQPTVLNCNGQSVNCTQDPNGYFANIQKLKLDEKFGQVVVPVGEVSFDASKDRPWSYEVKSRKYKLTNTVAHTEAGQTVLYNSLEINTDGKDYTIPIASSQTVEKYPESHFSFWNPHIMLGISGSGSIPTNATDSIKGELTPSIHLGIMSYGKTDLNPDLRILSVGLGYNSISKRPAAEISPIMFNVGKMISGKLMSNFYLGPVIGINTNGSVQVGAGLQVGL